MTTITAANGRRLTVHQSHPDCFGLTMMQASDERVHSPIFGNFKRTDIYAALDVCPNEGGEEADRIADDVRDLLSDWADRDHEDRDVAEILFELAQIVRPFTIPTLHGSVVYAIPVGSQHGREDEVELRLFSNDKWIADDHASYTPFELLTHFHNHRIPKDDQ